MQNWHASVAYDRAITGRFMPAGPVHLWSFAVASVIAMAKLPFNPRVHQPTQAPAVNVHRCPATHPGVISFHFV